MGGESGAARGGVWTLPEADWDDPELQGLMAEYLVELKAAGKLPADPSLVSDEREP